jgi:hypothetical protein
LWTQEEGVRSEAQRPEEATTNLVVSRPLFVLPRETPFSVPTRLATSTRDIFDHQRRVLFIIAKSNGKMGIASIVVGRFQANPCLPEFFRIRNNRSVELTTNSLSPHPSTRHFPIDFSGTRGIKGDN